MKTYKLADYDVQRIIDAVLNEASKATPHEAACLIAIAENLEFNRKEQTLLTSPFLKECENV